MGLHPAAFKLLVEMVDELRLPSHGIQESKYFKVVPPLPVRWLRAVYTLNHRLTDCAAACRRNVLAHIVDGDEQQVSVPRTHVR
jgi:hypothetical protein